MPVVDVIEENIMASPLCKPCFANVTRSPASVNVTVWLPLVTDLITLPVVNKPVRFFILIWCRMGAPSEAAITLNPPISLTPYPSLKVTRSKNTL